MRIVAYNSGRAFRTKGTQQIHRPGFLRGDELPWKREARRRKPNSAERVFDVDHQGQAQPGVPGADGGRGRKNGADFETRREGGGSAEMSGVSHAESIAGAARTCV